MIKKELQCETLQDYYNQLLQIQQESHGEEYTLVHNEIAKRLEECESYTEFGVMQGPTLAIACLANVQKVRGYDIKLRWYNKAANLFDQYAVEHDLDFKVIQGNSTACRIDPVDLLYIDSKHKYAHLSKELSRHAAYVEKYIIMHDTSHCPELATAITEFLTKDSQWELVTKNEQSVGFTTIQRRDFDFSLINGDVNVHMS